MLTSWVCVIIAGFFEILMALFLKMSDGFKNIYFSGIMLIFLGLSFYFLSLSLKELPLGSAYAIWTGLGAIGTFVLSIIFFGEIISAMQILFLLFIVTGIVGLKVVS